MTRIVMRKLRKISCLLRGLPRRRGSDLVVGSKSQRNANASCDQDRKLSPTSAGSTRRRWICLHWFHRFDHWQLLLSVSRHCVYVGLGRRVFPVQDMTFRALKSRIGFLLLKLHIENAVCC